MGINLNESINNSNHRYDKFNNQKVSDNFELNKILTWLSFRMIFSLLLLFLSLFMVHSYHWSGNTLYDLEFQGFNFFEETGPWECSTALVTAGGKSSLCGPGNILGGYNVMGPAGTKPTGAFWYRIYDNLPSHSSVKLQVTIYPVDSWDGTAGDDHFEIMLDSTNFVLWNLETYDASIQPVAWAPTNICGSPDWNDLPPMTTYITMPHSASTLTLKVFNELNGFSDGESIGFREVILTFSSQSVSTSHCGVTSGYPLADSACPCGSGTSMTFSNSGLCGPCHASCATCNGIGSSSCLSCPDGYYLSSGSCLQCASPCFRCSGDAGTCVSCVSGYGLVGSVCYLCQAPLAMALSGGVYYCQTPCTGQFAYWDYSCSSSCPSPYVQQTAATYALCTFPCADQTMHYYNWNGSCISGCPSPLTQSSYLSRNFCDYGCTASQFLYWNGSCLSGCESPLISEIQGTTNQRKFCWFPCPSSQYLYWNGSCLSECPSPLTPEIQGTTVTRKFCWYTCQPTQYLYWNGSCLGGCESPLAPEIQGTYLQRNFCWYPCPLSDYLYWNGSCVGTCPSPLSAEIQGTTVTRKFCWYGCQPDKYLYWNGSCLGSCESPLVPEIQGTYLQRSFCWFPCPPSQHLYWNGSCITGCPSPLSSEIQGTTEQRKFCWYSCEPEEFLYWNGSCLGTCPYPLSEEIQGTTVTRKFCWYLCQPSEFLYWNGSCVGTCPSPLGPETQGTVEQRKFCWYPCQPDEYLYWNGSCITECPSPLSPEIQGTTVTRKFCWYTCQPTQYLYWNGSCVGECPSPLSEEIQGTTVTRKFCWYSCQPDEYLYWNESCLSGCPSPLSVEIQGTTMTRNFCWYTCQPDQYLYWNMSCLDTCPSPLSPETQGTVDQRNFCWFPCQSGEYLYWNESCSSTCPLPLTIVNNLEISYCFLPCDYPSIYWYKNNSCLSACDYPYLVIPYSEVLQCLSPCKDLEYFYDQESKCYSSCNYPYEKRMIDIIKICHLDVTVTLEETENILSNVQTIKAQGEYTSGAMKAASAFSSSSPASALLAGLSSMLQYIRYMKVNYPPKVQVLFMVSTEDPISLGFDFGIPAFIEDRLVDYPLPEVFEKYDINSNFLNNIWGFLMTLIVNLLTIFLFILLDVGSRKYSKINKGVGKVLQVMKWNTPLAMICSSCGDIFFYSSLQFQSSPLDSVASVVCFSLCILMIILVIALFVITLKIMQSYNTQKKKNTQKEAQEGEDWKDKWSGCEILFIEYEETALLSVGYMALFIIRGVLFNLTIANLYNFPLTQSIIINLTNLLMFGYLLYLRPLRELLGIVQLFVTEGIVNIVSICVLILAIIDKVNLNGDGQAPRVAIGNVMVFCIQAFNTAALVFMGIGMLLFLISAYRMWRILRKQGIKSPLQMFKMILFGDIEAEIAKAAGLTSSFARIVTRRPKIRKPPRREKPVDQGTVNVIRLDSTDNSLVNLPIEEKSGNIFEKSFLKRRRLDPLKLHHHQQQSTGELEITDLDTSQTVIEQGSPERPFRGLDDTVLDGIKNPDKSVLEKDVLSLGKPEPGLKRVDMFDSLRKLKARMNKFGNVEFQVEDKQWYDRLRKLKARLKNRPTGGINLEDHSGNS